jgi:hypothetical protein
MHRYHELTEYDSRLSELIDYFGWDGIEGARVQALVLP